MNLLKSEHGSTRNLRSTPSFARRHTRLERVSIVPGHPIWRVPEQFSAVSFQLCQVAESVSAAQLLQHITAFLGKVLGHLHKLASCMRDAISQDHLEFFGRIARKGIAHLDRWT